MWLERRSPRSIVCPLEGWLLICKRWGVSLKTPTLIVGDQSIRPGSWEIRVLSSPRIESRGVRIKFQPLKSRRPYSWLIANYWANRGQALREWSVNWHWEHETIWGRGKLVGAWDITKPFNIFSREENLVSMYVVSATTWTPPFWLLMLANKLSPLVVSHCKVFFASSSRKSQALVSLLFTKPSWHVDSTMVLVAWSRPSYTIWHKR